MSSRRRLSLPPACRSVPASKHHAGQNRPQHRPRLRHAIDLEYLGLKCLDIYRLAQIADRLDVSIDWLLGRTSVMALPASAAT